MKIANSYTFDAPRETIWPLIYDPVSLLGLIPGCEGLEQVSPDEYRGTIQVRLPGVAGIYTSYVKLLEQEEPRYCRFEGEVQGAAGIIKGSACFELIPLSGQTRMQYEGQGVITGPLAGLDSRFAEGVVKTFIQQGLTRLNKQVREQPAGEA